MSPTFLPRLDIDPNQYLGGVGVWGALPAIFDTTRFPVEHGVHVHARRAPGRKKDFDGSYGEVHIALPGGSAVITEASATPYVAAAVLGVPVREISCPYCSEQHLDTDRFAVHAHQRHLCVFCGCEFLEAERSVGNPIVITKRALNDASQIRPTTPGLPGPLRIDQTNPALSGGVLIWGSNPAILWTASRDESEGIHVHAFQAGVAEPVVDETYQLVEIDGICLDAKMVRIFMVQQSLPYLSGAVLAVPCPRCNAPHFDDAIPFAVTPHRNHRCTDCLHDFATSAPVVANPLADVLERLYENAGVAGTGKNPLAR